MPTVVRDNSCPKWKQVLGFDNAAATTTAADDDMTTSTSTRGDGDGSSAGSSDPSPVLSHTGVLPYRNRDGGGGPIVPFAELEAQTNVSQPSSTTSQESPELTQKAFKLDDAKDRVSYSNLPEVVPGTVPEVIKRSITTRRSFFRRSNDPNGFKAKAKAASDLPEPIEFLVQEPTIHRFPRDITFTRYGKHDFLLSPSPPAPSAKDPKPLPSLPAQNYISIHDTFSGLTSSAGLPKEGEPTLPDIAVHAGASKDSELLSFASFHSATFTTAITLLPSPPPPDAPPPADGSSKPIHKPVHLTKAPHFGNRNQGHRTVKLASTGGIFSAEKYTFSHTLPRTSVLENFEWRHSSSALVRGLSKTCGAIETPVSSGQVPKDKTDKANGSIKQSSGRSGPSGASAIQYNGGMKLVRCTTGKTVAIFAGDREGRRDGDPRRAAGMLRFLANDEGGAGGGAGESGKGGWGLGEEFELLAIMSILCVMERGKRVMEVHRLTLGDGLV